MQLINGKIILSASDLTNFLACEHLIQLELAALRQECVRPEATSPDVEVLTRRGLEHEQRYLKDLRSQGLSIVEIEMAPGKGGIHDAAQKTIEAMRRGVDVVYQGALFDGQRLGRPDFLRRVLIPSDLGPFSYEVEDTKLARRVRASALLQVCAYSEQLTQIQGHAPERVHVILGDMTRYPFFLRDYAAYFRKIKTVFEKWIGEAPVETYPHPVAHCAVCQWGEVCKNRIRGDDHLYQVAGIRRDQANKLAACRIKTLADLAALQPGVKVPGIGQPALERLRHQASLQLAQRQTGEMKYDLLEPAGPRLGLGALPPPMADDLFFDMEGDPFAEEGGLEYLFGVVATIDGEPEYQPFWGHNRTEEKRAFEEFIDFIMVRLERNPNLHVYHYASYEPGALKRLMGLHATREEEVDRLLRGGVLIDLYRVVRQGVRISGESYSIKDIEPLYNMIREGIVKDAASSIVAYEEWLETEDDGILKEIAKYNRQDCLSLWKMQAWLEKLRLEAEAKFRMELSRPEYRDPEPTEALAEAEAETQELIESLTRDVPADPSGRTVEQQARWLLAQLLGWHRREAKAGWWAYFSRLEMTDDELVEDSEAIGKLSYVGVIGTVRQSAIYRYQFDPDQDHKIKEGDTPVDPATGKSAGKVQYVDSLKGILGLTRSIKREFPHPTSVIPGTPINTTVIRQSLGRVARWIIEHGIEAPGPYRAVRDLLLSSTPRIQGLKPGELLAREGESTHEAARRLVHLLSEACLPIQGPPGAGKTYAGARMIVDLIRKGRRVGITATSHKAISNLLKEVCQYAVSEGIEVNAIQKAPEGDQAEAANVIHTNINEEVESALNGKKINLVAGTAWLFARPGLHGRLHALFVDEAAQMSLANVVAVGGAADNLILLGDPRQLAQPSQGSHPPGAERSALEHLLGEHATIPPNRGLFLERTWRLHPDICKFVSEIVYEGRLSADPTCAIQAVGRGPKFEGTGLWYLPVEHYGNRTSSSEEAALVAAGVKDLIGREWTSSDGKRRPITLDDILIVAPYNAQVARIAALLPHGARVGTVDKFQGQEAPVVFYSMATSTLEDIPRGMDFLYSLNRLNVAISRARGLAALVCSPNLLYIHCSGPEDMRLVNALCRFVELSH